MSSDFIKEQYLDSQGNSIRLPLKDERRIINNAKKILAVHRRNPIYIFGDILEIEKVFNTIPI